MAGSVCRPGSSSTACKIARMAALQKITTTYSESEDRLRLAGQDAAGATTAVLWLTQRLTNRLVRALTQWLEGEKGGALAAAAPDLRQAWAQETARRQLQPSAPVPVTRDVPGTLVASVDLTRDGKHYTIGFRQADTTSTLALSSTELRQWLGILRSLYLTAGWPLADWPAWMEENPRAARRPVLFH